MSPSSVILIGLFLSILTIWIVAYNMENGDINAMSMYFVVFLFPAILLVLANGLLINTIQKFDRIKLKRILSMAPIPVMLILALGEEIKIPYLDGSVSFVGIIGLVSIGLTNLIWNVKLSSNKSDG